MTSHGNGRGPRRPRGGGSRRRGGDDRRSRQSTPAKAPAKKSFFETITDTIKGLFGGNGNPPIARPPVARTETPRNVSRSEQPQRQERQERTQRKPESVEVTTPRLYVGNLSFEATESDLFELFNGVGKVQNAEVVTYKHNQRSKGFAFVQMLTVEEAQRAVTELHDKDFLGRKLVVSGAKSTEHAES
ncbi:MAG TPA: hypothetical protein VK993_14815 [Chthoniobacterales bacterium]|nr:hypothetical protein [Chthoniobacterales bacterium]